ncbi:MAG: SpaA isopeptide-forming pilin-related protein [Defluviitaleaceae bacterium]|nr:SpaA isopeptide-forming pilin-related protein [Defluviitaleaceae bacterium]
MYIKVKRKPEKKAAMKWRANLWRVSIMTLTLSIFIACFALFASVGDGGYGIEFESYAYTEDYQYDGYTTSSGEERPYDYTYESHDEYTYELHISDDYDHSGNDSHYSGHHYYNYAPEEYGYFQQGEYTLDDDYNYEDNDSDFTSDYIEIMPLSYTWPTIMTHPAQLQAHINAIPENGVPHRIRLGFSGNQFTTTGTQIPTITVTGNRHIILDSNNASVQIWNRDQSSGRHFEVAGGATLELWNVSIARSSGFDPTVISGGIQVYGGAEARSSTLILNHSNARIAYNRAGYGGGGVFVDTGGRFYLYNGSINSNTGSRGGGILVAGVGSTATMHGGNIYNNNSETGGGAAITNGGSFDMRGGTIGRVIIGSLSPNTLGNHARYDGGAVYVIDVNEEGSVFRMSGGSITGNTNNAHGAIRATIYSRIFISDYAHIHNNWAGLDHPWPSRGGGISISGAAHGEISGGIIEHNRGCNGGGVMVDASIHPTTGDLLAGTVYVSGSAIIRYNRYTAIGEVIPEGGGLWIGQGILLGGSPSYSIIYGGSIYGNHAVEGGGVFVAQGGGLWMSGGHVFDNTATYGGGVKVSGGNTFTGDVFTPSTFHHYGGIIGSSNQDFGNRAVSGGGVHVSDGAVFNLSDRLGALIQGNTATGTATNQGGGGVFVIGAGTNFNLQNGIISENRATRGGGVKLVTGDATAANPARLTMTDGIIQNNRVNHTNAVILQGGGVFATGSHAVFNMSGGTIGNTDRAQGNQAGNGGGVYLGLGATFNMQAATALDAQIFGNTATASTGGGGVLITDLGSELNITGGTIGHSDIDSGNFAPRGGGIAAFNGSTVNMTHANARVIGNTATGTGASGGGGGVLVLGVGTHLIFENGIIEHNRATRGGGVRLDAGTAANPTWFNMTGGNIRNNRVNHDGAPITAGGGVFITGTVGTTQFNMSGGNIGTTTEDGNRAVSGGGVFVENGAWFDLSGAGNIRGNEAANGGGVFVSGANALATMRGGFIGGPNTNQGNVATAAADGSGGGVRVTNSARFNMTDGIIQNNRANRGAGVSAGGHGVAATHALVHDDWLNEASYELYEYEAEYNQHYNYEYGYINIAPQSIPTRPALPANTLTLSGSAQIRNNTAAAYGGGVHLSGGAIFNMHSGNPTIASNSVTGTATGNGGGGVYITTAASQFNMTSGTIGGTEIAQGNTAHNGGGIFVQNGTANLATTSSIVRNNQANAPGSATIDGGGGGIYVANQGQLTVSDAHITHNRAPAGMGGGIFTENHEYAHTLTLLPSPGFPRYSNITLTNVTFSNNTASGTYAPPTNAAAVLPGPFVSTSPASGTPEAAHPLNNWDINFSDGQTNIDFSFIKTDNIIAPQNGTRLQGAGFQLYRRADSSEAWAATGTPVFSNTQGVIQLSLSTNGQYRLVEIIPPQGFQAPFGYWIIVVSNVNGDYVVSAINSHGGNPVFVQHSGNWWVGNRPDFELPLTGGSGTARNTIMLAGMSIVILASGVLAYIKIKPAKAY